jgi:hypothetical protein
VVDACLRTFCSLVPGATLKSGWKDNFRPVRREYCQKISPLLKSLMRNPEMRRKPIRPLNFIRSAVRRALVALTMFGLSFSSFAENKVLKLDGHGSYVALPPNIFKDLTQATVEVWAKWATFNAYSRVFEFGAGYQSMSLFNHATTPDVRFNLYPRQARYDTSLLYYVRAPRLLHSNEWIHLAAVSGDRGMKLYANGVLVGQHSNTACFADIKVFQTNFLGRGLAKNPNDRDFEGEIDEVRVWNHRRTSAQIRENMLKRLTGKEEGLVALYNFDNGTADDSSPYSNDGRLVGNAAVNVSDLAFPSDPAAEPITRRVPATNTPPVAAAVPVPANNPGMAAWWIAGALSIIVALLAWLAWMLRRSGLGTPKLLPTAATPGVPAKISMPQTGPSAGDDMKQRALEELADFAKQSLVQGLYSQRAALLEAHQKAQQELAEIEARVVALHLPERIQAYEKRIAELEKELETRGDELRELTHATLQVLRQRLEEEKQAARLSGRLN